MPLVATVALVVACSANSAAIPILDGSLSLGTWGGDNAGLIVSDTAIHLHVGCTYGDASGRIPLTADGHFDVAGRWQVHAYPLVVGPAVPARFTGQQQGETLVITATVNDTVAHATTTYGPVTLRFGANPVNLPCPICRRPVHTRSAMSLGFTAKMPAWISANTSTQAIQRRWRGLDGLDGLHGLPGLEAQE